MLKMQNSFLIGLLSLLLASFSGSPVSAGSLEQWAIQLGHADDDMRTEAALELLKMRTPEAAYALADFMDSAFMDWRLKIEIMKLLAERKLPRAVKSLAVVLEIEQCPALKWHAARALGNFAGSEPALASLLRTFPDEDEPQVREGIVMSLGELRDGRAVALLSALLRDKSFAVRHAAMQALGKIGSPEALPHLQKALQAEKDAVAQEALRNAIRTIESGMARM
ncbi:MAG TPA: HEAT repeat domain-containing protein [Dissulfurispiraceae bacterium]|nr:HEAT repeat domain-containing protein [Dissulfurispiraceae bacterium]